MHSSAQYTMHILGSAFDLAGFGIFIVCALIFLILWIRYVPKTLRLLAYIRSQHPKSWDYFARPYWNGFKFLRYLRDDTDCEDSIILEYKTVLKNKFEYMILVFVVGFSSTFLGTVASFFQTF